MNHRIVISGCSGGGKSTLLAELRLRGHAVVEEPGRRIIREETQAGGQALPWVDMEAFLRRAVSMAMADHADAAKADDGTWTFFDRSLVDAAAALDALNGGTRLPELGHVHRYHARVFLAPPWPEIYTQDTERRHDMAAALAEFRRLELAYPLLGYSVSLLPKTCVEARADFVLRTLETR